MILEKTHNNAQEFLLIFTRLKNNEGLLFFSQKCFLKVSKTIGVFFYGSPGKQFKHLSRLSGKITNVLLIPPLIRLECRMISITSFTTFGWRTSPSGSCLDKRMPRRLGLLYFRTAVATANCLARRPDCEQRRRRPTTQVSNLYILG